MSSQNTSQENVRVTPDDVYAQTEKGGAELKSPGTKLSAHELQVLVLVDGNTTVEEIGKHARHIGQARVQEIVAALLKAKLVTAATTASSDGLSSGFFTIAVPSGFFKRPNLEASAEAETGASTLKQKGYYARIARRAQGRRRPVPGEALSVLSIEDDPDLVALLRTCLKLEGMTMDTAADRAGIVAAFRRAKPDLVLLDVELPDINGFDVLARMREHPVLKTLPVIMLTGAATRESVLKGLIAGADGYVTKPFETDVLMQAVRAVLGMAGDPPPHPDAQPFPP